MDSLKLNNFSLQVLKSPSVIEKVISFIYVAFIIFTALHFVVPYTHESGSISNVKMSYATNIAIDHGQQKLINIYFFDYVYLIGHYTCHQRSDRSFFMNNNQMPVCSRCLGIYLGMSLVFLIALLRRPSGSFIHSLGELIDINIFSKSIVCDTLIIIILGAILAIPMLADAFLQIFTSYLSNSCTRIFTGFLFGLVEGGFVIGVLSHIAYMIKNRTK